MEREPSAQSLLRRSSVQPECYKQPSDIFTTTNYYNFKILHRLSTTAMATATEFGAKDVRGLEDQNMEVDQQEQQVEQVSQESKEPEPEKPVSRFGCASE